MKKNILLILLLLLPIHVFSQIRTIEKWTLDTVDQDPAGVEVVIKNNPILQIETFVKDAGIMKEIMSLNGR